MPMDTIPGTSKRADEILVVDDTPASLQLLADLLTEMDRLCIPIGLVDNPFDQCREVLTIDLRADGGLAVGAPGEMRDG